MTEEERKAFKELVLFEYKYTLKYDDEKNIEIIRNMIINMQKEIERLQRIKSCNISKMIDEEKVNIYTNYIPKSKIKKHIQELEKKKEIEVEGQFTYEECLNATIGSFKSILESEE